MSPSTRRTLAAALAACAMSVWPASARAEPAPVESAAPSFSAANVPTLSEEQLFERWLRASAEVAALRAQVGAARFDVVTAELLPNPELLVGGALLAAGTPPDGQSGLQAQLTVPLPVFGQIPARRRAAESLVSVAEVTVLSALWERAADLQSAMVDAAFADARVTMLEANLDELARLRRIVETRTQAGANSAYDVLRVTTSETTVRAATRTAITDRTQAESRLLALMAEPTLTRVHVTREGLATFRGPGDEGALVKLALERRPDLELSRRNVVASSRSAERWRKDAIPTPSLFAGAYAVQGPFGVQVTAGVTMPLPIFDRNQGQVGRALSEAHASGLMSEALEVRIKTEVQGAWRAREAARGALREYREAALPAAAEMLRRAEVSYQAAKFSIAELFDAYRTLWDARLQELDLERQMALAEVSLERAAVLVPLGAPGRAPAPASR
ncbi:MAG: TolC family protein [Labilithrix sp.]|nr:TolC family protein [Labilithrix sp.]